MEAGVSSVGVRPRWKCSGEPQVRICEGWREVKEVEEARNFMGGEGRGWVDCGEGEVRREGKEGKVWRRVMLGWGEVDWENGDWGGFEAGEFGSVGCEMRTLVGKNRSEENRPER